MIRILQDHEGTQIGDVAIAGDRVVARMLAEPMTRADWVTHDYNVHFCIGLHNDGPAARDLELSIEGGLWDDLPETAPALYAARSATGPFEPATFPARTDLRKRYCIRLKLDAGERVYVANTLVRPTAALTIEYEELAKRSSAQQRVIGQSLAGRDIVAYIYGDPSTKASLLVTSGFHPPEPDTLATAEIMSFLATPSGKKLLDKFAVAVVPLANPDGYATGTQGANAAGINFYWHFARERPTDCPEAAALWAFSNELAPRGYIDFHCYTFQLKKRAGPYERPAFFHESADVRHACRALYATLDDRIPGKAVRGFGTYAPHTLGAMLAARFDTLALAKYHLHLAEGPQGCRDRGREVFSALADTLIDHGQVERGARRRPGWRDPFRKALIYWAGFVRPNLGWLRRGRLDMVRLDRTAQVTPGAPGGIEA